jgi:hypothetical protein
MPPVKQHLARGAKRLIAPLTTKTRPDRDVYLAIAELARRASAPAGDGPADLTGYELRVFSQNGEDGVLAEIFRRIGPGGRTFVEFGTEAGYEATCVYLADVLGWSGFFIDGDEAAHAGLSAKYAHRPDVVTHRAFLTPESIEREFAAIGVPAEPDVLSIDVDGGDYWLWEAVEAHRPRVVVVEYNSLLGPEVRLVQPRGLVQEGFGADFGASIGALAALGERKGYRLVHCELAGVNAFFVRDDQPGPWPERVLHRTPNYNFAGARHAERPRDWRYEVV